MRPASANVHDAPSVTLIGGVPGASSCTRTELGIDETGRVGGQPVNTRAQSRDVHRVIAAASRR